MNMWLLANILFLNVQDSYTIQRLSSTANNIFVVKDIHYPAHFELLSAACIQYNQWFIHHHI